MCRRNMLPNTFKSNACRELALKTAMQERHMVETAQFMRLLSFGFEMNLMSTHIYYSRIAEVDTLIFSI